MKIFDQIANSKEHTGYRKREEVFSHTVDGGNAAKMIKGYINILNFYNFKLNAINNCIDIGCGAGYITREFSENNFNIKGMEYSEDALTIAKEHNPNLEIIQGDMSKFKEENQYDFIFSREVYLITRVNCFTEQKQIISNIVDSLKLNGIFMLVASDVSYPNCMDYNLIIKTIKKDKNILVSSKYHEFIFKKFNKFIFGKISYKILELLLMPLILYKKNNGWASQYIIIFQKI
ncbi:MAG: class I SAM-dependent methyltransferase [Arcobacteraceae bacterium]|nr:class I SAM-dependent methyltransferase [Arcobacteraceae bacterium]